MVDIAAKSYAPLASADLYGPDEPASIVPIMSFWPDDRLFAAGYNNQGIGDIYIQDVRIPFSCLVMSQFVPLSIERLSVNVRSDMHSRK
jgi:hypothetical protein